MEPTLSGAIVGGAIGIVGSLFTSLLLEASRRGDRYRCAVISAVAEIRATRQRAERVETGVRNATQFHAGATGRKGFPRFVQYLCADQATAVANVWALEKEAMIPGKTGDIDIGAIALLLKACHEALSVFGIAEEA